MFILLCKQHKINSLFAFGSAIHGPFNEDSDVDFIVDIEEPDPINRGELLLSLWNKLESFFHRRIDLLTFSSIRNPFLKENIEKTKQLVYDGSKEEILL